MHRPRLVATVLAAAVVLGGVAVGGPPALADGTSPVPLSCQAPFVGTTQASVDVTATDSADPILVGGAVTNTVKVPVPALDDLPFSITVREVKLTTPIPAGVTVTGVTFTPSSFSGQSWVVTGGNLVVTLTGSIPLSPGGAPPTVPEVRTATTVTGAPRIVSWKVPSLITAKADTFLGSQTASCTPVDPAQVLTTTTVNSAPPANRPPVATAQSVSTPRDTAKNLTLTGTDPDADPLTFAVVTGPAHGSLTGTAPNLTYTPATDYVGPDAFTFTAGDGQATSSAATVAITVTKVNRPPVPGSPSVATTRGTALPVTLAATDADGDALTYTVTTPPAHGTVTGAAPAATYTPAAGYVGSDVFGFRVTDGTVNATGTVTITVRPAPPGAPTIAGTPVALPGTVRLAWTAPADTGGLALTGYRVTPIEAGVPQAPVTFSSTDTTQDLGGLQDGVAYTFRVAAFHASADGPLSAPSAAAMPQAWRPFASWTAAVDQIHQWMLRRPATTAERSLWVGRLQIGTHTLPDLVVALRRGTVHVGTVDPITRLYQAYFLRVPDRDGIVYWVDRRQTGLSLAKASEGFARSAEFIRLYGQLTNREFVERIYENVLGRPGEAAGITYWTSELDAGRRSRGSVMAGFSESAEYRAQQAANVDASTFAIYLEDRTPTASERSALAAEITGGTPLTTIVRRILSGPIVVARASG